MIVSHEQLIDKIDELSINVYQKQYDFINKNRKAIIKKIKSSINNKFYEKNMKYVVDNFKIFSKSTICINFGIEQESFSSLCMLPHSLRDLNLGYAASAIYNHKANILGISVFTKHFFDRYRERFLKNESLSMSDVIDSFFKNNNPNLGYIMPWKINCDKYIDGHMAVINDGIAIVVTKKLSNKKIIRCAVTFVTFDTINKFKNINKETCLALIDYNSYCSLYNTAISNGYPKEVVNKIDSVVQNKYNYLVDNINGFKDAIDSNNDYVL